MRFVQVKMWAQDPERLATFYCDVFGCEVAIPLTTLDLIASHGVGNPGSEVSIMVLTLPGSDDGPTLELISMAGGRKGEGMLTFYVDDVETVARKVEGAGGSFQGEIVEFVGPSGTKSRFVFMGDPEGNTVDVVTRVG